MNQIQEDVYDNLHTRNLILKARQLGMSTFSVIYLLDEVIFKPNLNAGIVSYSLEHAQHIFKKIIGHALDTLPKVIKPLVGIVQRSAREITLSNGSALRVDTTLRGGSYPLVLVSEFGKTCARNPAKAEEVITGTLQSVPTHGKVIIESTGEGSDGFFADMVLEASRRTSEVLTPLDYKLFFFPWWRDKSYSISPPSDIDVTTKDYLDGIEAKCKIILNKEQRSWYYSQQLILADKIKQEYPSTLEESFLTSSDAYYFSEKIQKAYEENRCLYSPLYDALCPLYVAMDIGINDLTVMVFFQSVHGEIRVIDYYEDKNKGLDFYAKFLLQDKNYLYHTIFLPHDSKKRDPLDAQNSFEREFRKLFSATNTKFHVLPRMDKQHSIANAKMVLDRCVFNISKVKPFLDNMAKYRKVWNETMGRYLENPLHNEASNYADCFQYLAQAVGHLETAMSLKGSLEKHKKLVESRYKRII